MSLEPGQLLLAADTAVTCPKCAHEFSLDQGFANRTLAQLSAASAAAIAAMRNNERAEVEKRAQRQREQFARAAAAAQLQAAESAAAQRKDFDDQLAAKNSQVQALRDEQLTLRKEREQLQDEKKALALEVQKQVDAQIQNREAVIRAQEQDRATLDKAVLQKKLDDAGEQLAAAKRKIEQGSQQLQGEVLELAIEEGLRRAFPLDQIEEVKKGQRGGDVLQHVLTRTGQAAGTILWETKRAKDWSVQWIPKLKEDMRASGAALGILVTMPGTFPKDWPTGAYFSLYEDVWVTQASTSIGIAEALRTGLIDLHRQRAVAAGKGEKMEALYDYLTSPQFAQKLKAVYETFKKMREELDSEKNVTTQRWARREKQLQGGLQQLLAIGGEIQGLSQQELPMLEMETVSPQEST
ncbi:MAG TPA: DUF2130 domain-containing protein [Steroidobacteraceae bacterium]|nr:DUF2130 domain-containing protein [Steroidobacteraceae bacterium]